MDLLKSKRIRLFRFTARPFIKPNEDIIRKWRKDVGIKPDYKLVDTCVAEFEAFTPYYYSTYES